MSVFSVRLCRGTRHLPLLTRSTPNRARQDFGKVPARFWGDVEGLAATSQSARSGHIRKVPRGRAPLFRIIRAAKTEAAGKGSARFPG